MEVGFVDDVIGSNNLNTFCIGDIVFIGPRMSFPSIPSFSQDLLTVNGLFQAFAMTSW